MLANKPCPICRKHSLVFTEYDNDIGDITVCECEECENIFNPSEILDQDELSAVFFGLSLEAYRWANENNKSLEDAKQYQVAKGEKQDE